MPDVPSYRFGGAVDLAYGFAGCWTGEGTDAEVTEWARQLHAELDVILKAWTPEATESKRRRPPGSFAIIA